VTVAELVNVLGNYPSETPVRLRVSVMNCYGHGPDEYCYCEHEDTFFDRNITAQLDLPDRRKKKQETFVTIVGD
jgi:hypothetical protein